MSRSMWDIPTGKPLNDVNFIVNDYLIKEGFKIVDYKGEKVWKKGSGWAHGPSIYGLQVFRWVNDTYRGVD